MYKCVLYYCHRVSTQLQFNISYHVMSCHVIYHIICHIIYHIVSYIISYHRIIYHIISYIISSYHISHHFIYHFIYIISYHIISYHIISYHIISYHIISYVSYISYISYIVSYHTITRIRTLSDSISASTLVVLTEAFYNIAAANVRLRHDRIYPNLLNQSSNHFLLWNGRS